jgi:CDP-diacylglycerol pyrophosphatase
LSEQEDRELLVEKLQEVKNAIKGLSMEVEGLRVSNDSSADFVLCALKDLLITVNRMLDEVNKPSGTTRQ